MNVLNEASVQQNSSVMKHLVFTYLNKTSIVSGGSVHLVKQFQNLHSPGLHGQPPLVVRGNDKIHGIIIIVP